MQAALAKLAANYGLGQGQQMDDTESVMFTEFERTWRKAAGDRGRLDAAVKNRLFAHAVEILFELMKPNSMADGYACTEAQLLGSLNTKFEQLTSEGPLAKAVHDTLADSFKAAFTSDHSHGGHPQLLWQKQVDIAFAQAKRSSSRILDQFQSSQVVGKDLAQKIGVSSLQTHAATTISTSRAALSTMHLDAMAVMQISTIAFVAGLALVWCVRRRRRDHRRLSTNDAPVLPKYGSTAGDCGEEEC